MNKSNITNYKPKEFANLLNVSVKTLQRCDGKNFCSKQNLDESKILYTSYVFIQTVWIA